MSAKNGREQRRFPRYDVVVPVILRKKNGDVALSTRNVSRHGALVHSEQPLPLRQLVQLRFRLPGVGDVDAMCMVARWIGPEHPTGPGVGVDLFALSKEAKTLWERFVAELRARAAFGEEPMVLTGVPIITTAAQQTAGVPLPPGNSPPEWLEPSPQKGKNDAIDVDFADPAFEIETIEEPSGAAEPNGGWPRATEAELSGRGPRATEEVEHGRVENVAPPGSVVMHRVASRDALRAFIDNEVQRGGMFLKTALVKEVGDKVDIALVHPETDEEFHLEGTVVRRVVSGPAEQRGLGIFFRALSPEGEKQLYDFIDSGIEVVELGSIISERQLELEAAVAREPDNAEALEVLGTYLLDEEGDLGGALTALTRALVLGPSVVSIHASLARAYRRIGDGVKVRAHERVAEALMMMQDRMKVRLGVGDDAKA